MAGQEGRRSRTVRSPWADAITRHAADGQAARHLGDRQGEAHALSNLGAVRRMTGDYRGAAQALEEALGIYRDLGGRRGEAELLNKAGTLPRVRDNLGRAGAYHRQALDLARQIASPRDKARALAGLGRCAQAAPPARSRACGRQRKSSRGSAQPRPSASPPN